MVASYVQSFAVQDCEVLAEYDMQLGGHGLCCAGDAQCIRAGKPSEIEQVLGRVFGVHGFYYPSSISYADIVAEIDLGRPMIAGLIRDASTGHVIVISGYRRPNFVQIDDPNTQGAAWITYDTLKSYQGLSWTSTYAITSNPSPKPMCARAPQLLPNDQSRQRAVCKDNPAKPVLATASPSLQASPSAPAAPLVTSSCIDCSDEWERCDAAAEDKGKACQEAVAMDCQSSAGCPCAGVGEPQFSWCSANCNQCLVSGTNRCNGDRDRAKEACKAEQGDCRIGCH